MSDSHILRYFDKNECTYYLNLRNVLMIIECEIKKKYHGVKVVVDAFVLRGCDDHGEYDIKVIDADDIENYKKVKHFLKIKDHSEPFLSIDS